MIKPRWLDLGWMKVWGGWRTPDGPGDYPEHQPHLASPSDLWCLVPQVGQLRSGTQWCQDPELSRMEPCPASGDHQTRRCHPECHWLEIQMPAGRLNTPTPISIQLCQYFYFSLSFFLSLSTLWSRPQGINSRNFILFISLDLPDEGLTINTKLKACRMMLLINTKSIRWCHFSSVWYDKCIITLT